MSEPIEVEFVGDLGKLYQELQQRLPAESRDAAKQAARLMHQEMERGAKQTADAIRREMQRAESSANQSFGKMKQGLGAVFGSGTINDIDDVVGAVGALGPVAGAAAVAVGLSGGLAYALYQAADATGRLDDEQAALKQTLGDLSREAGSIFANNFETAISATNRLAEGFHSTLRGAAALRFIGGALLDEYTTQAAITIGMMSAAWNGDKEAMKRWVDVYNSDQGYTGALNAGIDALHEWDAQVAAANEAAHQAEAAVGGEADARRAAADAARAHASALRDVAASEAYLLALSNLKGKQQLEAADDEAELDASFQANQDAITASQAEAWKKRKELLDAYVDESKAKKDEDEETDLERIKRVVDEYAQAYSAINGIVQSVTSSIIDAAEGGTKKQKEAARTAWTVQQAFAMGQAAVSGLQMGIGMAAQLAPLIGPAAPFAAAAIAVPFTAAQIAAIGSTPAPKFHTGLAPDEMTITKGELAGILTPRAVGAAGGPKAVQDMNRGLPPQGGQRQLATYWRGRMIDRVLADVEEARGPSSTYQPTFR